MVFIHFNGENVGVEQVGAQSTTTVVTSGVTGGVTGGVNVGLVQVGAQSEVPEVVTEGVPVG